LLFGIIVSLTVNVSFAQNFIEVGGVVDVESENPSTQLIPGDHSWILTNSIAGFSGTGYMEALPDNGTNITANVPSTSPELVYPVTFSATGTRYVWVRGYATNPSNDSVHVGINNNATTATNITFANSYNAWVWTNRTGAGNTATITVSSTNAAAINVWMREDGFRIDRLLLTTNANFSATLGNVFHIPNNTELGFTMRNPFTGITPDLPVSFYTGNQFQGTGNPGNQLQTGSTLYYKHATNSTWSSLPMFFLTTGSSGTSTNNKYYSVTLPGNVFNGGDTVQYYFKIPYDDHLPTFIYGNDSTRFNTEIESVAQAGAFSFTYAQPLQPNGPYISVTNAPTGAEARIYQNSGHIALANSSNIVAFAPPVVQTGSGPATIGAVLSSSNILNGVQVRQVFGATSIVAQITFPYDGVMHYEVVDWGAQVINAIALTAAADAGEHFFGFGEKFNALDQAGNKVHMITADIAGDKGDNSYKVTPWFISTKGYGFHLDATTESWFDMRASAGDRYVISNFVTSSFSGYVTNALKYNVVFGPKLTDVLTRYTGYTGRPALPPKWAFAPWMSSDIWHTGGEVRYTISKYRALGIPGSAFVFDSPWEVGYNDFTWNTTQWSNGGTYEGTFYSGFTSVGDMMTFMRTNGFYAICWMTPFVNTNSVSDGVGGQNTGQASNYVEGAASNYFVRASVNGPPLLVPWWKTPPNVSAGSPIDFTNPNAKLWAQKQLSNLVAQSQSGGFNVIGGFKTDDGEAINSNPGTPYIPAYAVYFDGRTGVEMRNGYCVEYHKSIWNVLGTNGLLFARSGFTGSQTYPGGWAGDNQPNFGDSNGLPSVVVASQSAAMSGIAIWASDIGGYQNSNYSSTLTNLFMRWTQFGAFSPLMQMHRQVDTSNLQQFPWGYDATALTNYIFYTRLHTALFPYLYSYALQASTNGLPIMRPLVLLNQDDGNTYGVKHTYYFGNELLVSPVITNTASTRQVYLPAGKWYDFFSNTVYTGSQTIIWSNANQSVMPLFVRDGAIIPMISTNVMTLCDSNYVANPALTTPDNSLQFLIYPTTNSSFTVYDGTSLNVQSNGTVITANLISNPRPIKLRFFAGPAAGVERDGVRLTTFTNLNGFVQVTFNHTGGTTQIRFGPDTVGDGISDSWRQTWFGGVTGNSCATCDPDGDGLNNLAEYLAGTSPLDPGNFLRIDSFSDFTLGFTTVTSLLYRVEMTDNLTSSWATLSNNISGTGNPLQINDPGAGTATQRFYRVRLLP
jgi:alpha-D-xyloside xylohydrolase